MLAARIVPSRPRLFACLLIILLCVCIARPLESQTLYVDDNTPPGTGNGSRANPFTTITEAVAASIIGQTRTISVAPGTYALFEVDPIRIPAGVTLAGAGMDSTMVQVSVVFSDSTAGAFANFCIADMSVRSVSCDCRGTQLAHEPVPIQIERCRVEHITLYETVGQMYVITDNIVTGALALADAGDSAFVLISGNVFEGGDPAYSIYIADNRAIMVAIWGNEIRQHDVILTDPYAFLEFSANEVQNGRVVLRGRQTASRDTAFASIHDNSVSFDGTHDHPDAYGRGRPAISSTGRMVHIGGNQIACGNGMNGVITADSLSWILDNAITVESPGFGLRLQCTFGEISGNEITGGTCGLLAEADSCTISNNVIQHADTGIVARGFSTFVSNLVDGCTADGLIIDGARGPFLRNEITHNGGAGVRIVRARWGPRTDNVVDLGGGPDSCEGGNTFRWNGTYNITVATSYADVPVISARYNRWNSVDPDSIRAREIYDGFDQPGLSVVDFSSFVTGLPPAPPVMPLQTCLEQNYPNPFNPKTVVSCQLAVASRVRIVVYDMLGREIGVLVDEKKEAGRHEVEFDGSGLSSGVYLCRMQSGAYTETKRLLLVR